MKRVTEIPRFEVRIHEDPRIRWTDRVDPRLDEVVREHVNHEVFRNGARKADAVLEAVVEHAIKCFLAEQLALDRLFIGAKGVQTIERKQQCKTCPWKRETKVEDIPNYAPELHAKLTSTIAAPGDVGALACDEFHLMACHYSTDDVHVPCVGWLHHQLGPGNNIALRIRAMDGGLDYDLDGEQVDSFEETFD